MRSSSSTSFAVMSSFGSGGAGTTAGLADGTAATGEVGAAAGPARPPTRAAVALEAMTADRSDTATTERMRRGPPDEPDGARSGAAVGRTGAASTTGEDSYGEAVKLAGRSGSGTIGSAGSGGYMTELRSVGIFASIEASIDGLSERLLRTGLLRPKCGPGSKRPRRPVWASAVVTRSVRSQAGLARLAGLLVYGFGEALGDVPFESSSGPP